MNAANLSGAEEHVFGFLRPKEILDLRLPDQVQFGVRSTDNI
jgi:hypothetical protein